MGWGDIPSLTPKKKKRGRGRVSPTGPYRAESSNPKVRSKASFAERNRFSHGSTPTAKRARKLERKDRRTAAKTAKRKATAAANAPASRPIETLRKAEAKLARKPDPKLREATRMLRHALAAEALAKAKRKTAEGESIAANAPRPQLKSVAPRAYEKALRASKPGGHGSSRGLGEPEDLTTAITLAVPGGGIAGALGKRAIEEGGGVVAKDIGEALTAKVEAKGSKAITKTLNAGSGVRAGGRLAGRAVLKAAGKDTTKLAEKATEAGAQRAARREAAAAAAARSKAANAVVPLKGVKAAALGTPVARGHAEAIVHNPKAVAKKTAVGAAGLVIGAVKGGIDVGVTGGRAASTVAHDVGVPGAAGYSGSEILAPVVGLGKEQLAFARQVARVVTASDSSMVQKEVEDNLGLMLPVILGLGGKAAGDKLGKGQILEGVRKIANRARREPLSDFHGKTPRVLERQVQHKTEARRVANARGRAKRDEQAATGRYIHEGRSAPGGEVVRTGVNPPRGRAAPRLRRGLAREEAKGNLVIRPADIIPWATRHSIDLSNPARAMEQLRAHRGSLADLPTGLNLPKNKLHTRDLLDYIERHPEVLESAEVKAGLEQRRKAGKYRREHKSELAPEHSERARFLSVATVKGRTFPEEMYPHSVRDIVRAKPEPGVLAKDVLRKEAREDKATAKVLKKKAGTLAHHANVMRGELAVREKLNKKNLDQPLAPWQVKELKAVKEMERRGIVPKGSAPVGGHLQVVTGEGGLPRATLPAHHERIRERIDELDSKAVDLRERAARSFEHSKRKNKAAQEIDPRLEHEFVEREKADLAAEGRPEPEYVHTGVAREGPTFGAGGNKLTQFPGKSKFRSGSAEKHGMVEEGLIPDVRESFRRPAIRRESYRAMRSFLDTNEFRVHGKQEWTSGEMRELFNDGVLNRKQWVAVPRQLYKRAYGKFDPEVAAGEMKLALEDKAPGSHFKLVRRPAAEEFFSQLSDALVSTKLVKVNRATNYLILATSPAWAAAQVVAEYTQGAIAQPKLLNPAWVSKAVAAYDKMPPHKRQVADAWIGVTSRELSRKEEMHFGTVEDAADAYSALHTTPLGHLLTSIRDFDQWKGGRIRTLVGMAKIDKELNGRLNSFGRGLGKLDAEMGKQLEAMKKLPLHEQMSFIADHPKWADRYQTYLDDVMGNWTALTKNERVASQLMIFYPFIRMSLRWTFYAFPKHHPIRAATLLYLSQQNATRIRQLLGGDPSYFSNWMKVPINLGDGKHSYVPLSRIVPGANAILESLGGGIEGPKTSVALRAAQPTLGAAATLATGVNPLTGKQEKGSFWDAMAQLFPTNLSAPGRALNEAVLPAGEKATRGPGQISSIFGKERQAALDKLTAKLYEKGTVGRFARQLGAPMLPEAGGLVRDREVLNRVLKMLTRNSSTARGDVATAYANRLKNAVLEGKGEKVIGKLHREREAELDRMEASYDEGNSALDKLFGKYGINHKREDELFLKFYGEGKYRTKKTSPGAQFGLPSTSGDALRKQFGLPSSSGEKLKEQFGIE